MSRLTRSDLKKMLGERISNDTCGTYRLMRNDECVYVGQSQNLPARILCHYNAKIIGFDDFLIINCKPEELDKKELDEIILLKPEHNKMLPSSSEYNIRSAVRKAVSMVVNSLVDEVDIVFGGGKREYLKISDEDMLNMAIEMRKVATRYLIDTKGLTLTEVEKVYSGENEREVLMELIRYRKRY